MAKPLSINDTAFQSVPECYIFPVHKRPGRSLPADPNSMQCKAVLLPVVDLSGDDHGNIVKQIIDAAKEFGFFQVANNGVPEQAMNDMMSTAEEFFGLPADDKMVHYSTDGNKLPQFRTSVGDGEEVLYWRDCLKLGCHPLEDFRHQWPEKPARLREALETYTVLVRGVAMRILRIVAVGLGLDDGYFEGKFSNGPVIMNVNHYVPCPDPSLTLGLPSHCDPNLLTVLMQNGVSGLQVMYGGDWIDVDPVPGSFIVNFGHQMEIISNGAVKGGEHRAVTNRSCARTLLAMFITPEMDCTVGPARELVSDTNPPLYRSFSYQEFFRVYLAEVADKEAVLRAFQIKK